METTVIERASSPVWKTEPESPKSWDAELFENVELWGGKEEVTWSGELWDDCKEEVKDELLPGDDLLNDIEVIIANEEPFNAWANNNMLYEDGYIWDCYKPQAAPVPVNQAENQLSDHAELLREFEAVLTKTTDSLTPPATPKSVQLMNILQEIESPVENEIDQLVKAEAERQSGLSELIQVETEKQSGLSISSGSCEPWSSPSSISQCDSGYSDPEWSPSSLAVDQEPSIKRSRRTTTTEERRQRKKEQNKNAATRYRQKKKQEMEGIMGEERGLQDENDRCKAEVVEITREIRYLKSLMRDLFKAKGLL